MRQSVAALVCAAWLPASHADRTVVHVPSWPDSPLYSHAVISGGMVYVAGTVGINMTLVSGGGAHPKLCTGGIKGETECAFSAIATVLKAAGTSMANLVDCTVFLGKMADYAALNAAWVTIFKSDPPARAAFAANELALGAAAEFKCIAAQTQ